MHEKPCKASSEDSVSVKLNAPKCERFHFAGTGCIGFLANTWSCISVGVENKYCQ